MFKFTALTTFLITLSLFFSSCAHVSSNVNNKAVTRLPEYEIVWYLCGDSRKDADIINSEISRYVKQKINASVKINMIPVDKYDDEIKAVISYGEKFDLCFTSAWINSYTYNVQRGSFKKLDGLLQKEGQGILKVLPQILLDSVKINGSIYALPPNKDLASQYSITFQKKLADKYGFDIGKVSALQDIEPMLRVIKKEEPNVVPYLICATDCHAFSIPIERFDEQVPSGLYYDNRTNYKVVNIMESPELKEYVTLMHRWYKEGFILKDSDSIKSLEAFRLKGNWFCGSAYYTPAIEETMSHTYGYDVKAVPILKPFVTKKDITYYLQAVSSTSENPERAMMLLNMFYTDEYLYNLLVYGIEGKHYNKASQNRVSPTCTLDFIVPYAFGNNNLWYLPDFFPASYKKDYEDLNKRAVISPLAEFSFDKNPVKREIEAITEVTEELEGPLFVGALDPKEYLPKIIYKYKAAGLDRVIAEQQKQIDAWLLTKRNQ